MKKRLIVTLLISALLVTYCLLGIGYMKQSKEYDVLYSTVTDVARELEQVPEPPQNLEQRLATAQANLAYAQGAFPSRPNSTQVINKILKLADECHVRAIPLATQQWSQVKTGEGYLVFRLHITVHGGFSQFVNFVSKLENGLFDTITIENLNVTRPVIKAEAKILPDMTSPITASLDVAIYARSGDSD